MARQKEHAPHPWRAVPSPNPRQNRALASDAEEPHPARQFISARRPRAAHRRLRDALQSRPLSREPRKPHARRRLFWTRPNHPGGKKPHQTSDHRQSPLAASAASRLEIKPDEPEPPIQKRSAVSNHLTTDIHQHHRGRARAVHCWRTELSADACV